MLSFVWNNFLFYPVLNLLLSLYHFFGDNLGWAVVVIAVLVRLLLIRSTKKQMTMTKTMATLKPKLDALNKKYANNKELLAKEQIKLYKKSGYNPLGCLFNFIPQMIILIVIIQVIRVVTTEDNYEGLYPFVEAWINGSAKEFVIDTRFYLWDLGKNYMENKVLPLGFRKKLYGNSKGIWVFCNPGNSILSSFTTGWCNTIHIFKVYASNAKS